MKNILIGCDPELFVFDNINNEIVNAEHYIPGSKNNPYKLDVNNYCLVDGITAEINPKPASSKNEFIENVLDAMLLLNLATKENISFKAITSAHLNEIHYTESCRTVGCDPDFNVYTLLENPKPQIDNVFFAGGHIHIGCDLDTDEKIKIVKTLDKQLLPFVNSLERKYKDDFELGLRKKVQYGKKGNFRDKPYGLEYRSVSNKWLSSDVEIGNVFEITLDVVKTLKQTSILTF
jgi:hypothetical protein